jgi:hypothetical protein
MVGEDTNQESISNPIGKQSAIRRTRQCLNPPHILAHLQAHKSWGKANLQKSQNVLNTQILYL